MVLNCGVGEDLRVPWTARRSNQSILKKISPEYSLERLMLKLETPALWPPDAKNWLLGIKYDQPREHIKKQRHYFANKGPSSQGYGFSSSHVSMWELDYKEIWVQKNWCFWTVVLEKTLESPLDCKEIQPVHSKDQSWDFFRRNDAKAETPILWPPHMKSWLIGKDSDAGRDWGLFSPLYSVFHYYQFKINFIVPVNIL